ncbi:MAG: FAD-dependent oxidoreductase [Actinomycetota bacterium]
MDYVIIGNSAAGIGAVEGIRSVDKKGTIAVISDEPYHTYSRPLISYYLGGKVEQHNMYYRPKTFYRDYSVEPMFGVPATKIDTTAKTVTVGVGKTKQIKYGKLLIAAGGTPFVPPITNLEGTGVFTFTKWDDAKALLKATRQAETAIVIGGGLIGLKAAEGLLNVGIKVTVVELADRVLSTILDAKGSKMFGEHLKALGVTLLTGDTVTGIVRDGEGSVVGASLKSGRNVEGDLVVVAIGVVPNTALTDGTKITKERGILVDEHLMTSVKDVYAAGDCVETFDVLRKTRRPQPIWPNAYEQGQKAGLNMAGRITDYIGSFGMNSIEVSGLPTITVGMYDAVGPKYEILQKSDPETNTYKKVILDKDRVVGAVFVGDIDRAGIMTGLIKDRVNVKAFKHDLISDNFGYAIFPETLRKERLSR